MAEARTIVTAISLGLAVLASGWAIYASKHGASSGAPPTAAGGGARRPTGNGPPGGAPAAPSASSGGFGGSGAVVNVVTAEAKLAPMLVGIEAIGTAVANESVNISSKSSNIITAIRFNDGASVRTGQILVELDSAQARADLAAATADFTEAAAQYKRSSDLIASQAVSQSQYDQLRATMQANEARVAAARARLSDTVIRAPFGGRVGLRRVSLGTLVNPGTVITTLDDTQQIKVDFSVPDMNVADLRAGQTIVAKTSAYPDREFKGQVTTVDSRIDPASRAVTVRARVPNAEGRLKPGMYLTVTLAKETRQALVIPEEALVPEQARQFVYVVAQGSASKREVQLGRREPGKVEIAAGLSAGERVVIEGTLKLREGSAVREAADAAEPAPSSQGRTVVPAKTS